MKTFQEVCKSWGVPLADDKTVEPVEVLTFLGVELDTINIWITGTNFCEPMKSG
jgi:hypothetical protein